MIRFLFLLLLFIAQLSNAATVQSFGDEHFYPMVERARGQKSKNLLIAGAVLTAASYNKQYEIPLATESQHKTGEDLGAGVFSGIIIVSQFILDDDTYNSISHLRGLAYDLGFVFGMKAFLNGRWPGANYNYQPFPSAHTSIAFMTATSLTYAYGWKAAIIAYPAAAFVGYSRLGYDCSRLSDVIAGATIGAWIGRASYYESAEAAKDIRLQKNPKLSSFEVFPLFTSNQIGTVVYSTF
ncbi:hypothetical protein CIK05_05290 [Bdellovibrio sp. qaytius]|nr:hypothetical protein CIK05_05290 [Bdellovibrio sp. qaytius]